MTHSFPTRRSSDLNSARRASGYSGGVVDRKDQNVPFPASVELTHLDRLEAESIHIMREVMADAAHSVMLYPVGKDSAVMLHLARKAFYPSPPPFPLLHLDTPWQFRATYNRTSVR